MVTPPPLGDDDAKSLRLLGQMVVAGAVAVAGASGPTLAGAAGAIGIPAVSVLHAAIERWRLRSQQRVQFVIDEASSESCLTDEQFMAATTATDDHLLLMQKAVGIACNSPYAEKLRVVARAWAEAVRDPTKVEQSRFKLESLQDLEAPHVVVLQALDASAGSLSRADLCEQIPLYVQVLDPILQTLHSAGLAYAGTAGGIAMGNFLPAMNDTRPQQAEWHITEWGRQILLDLRSAG